MGPIPEKEFKGKHAQIMKFSTESIPILIKIAAPSLCAKVLPEYNLGKRVKHEFFLKKTSETTAPHSKLGNSMKEMMRNWNQ